MCRNCWTPARPRSSRPERSSRTPHTTWSRGSRPRSATNCEPMPQRIDLDAYVKGVLDGSRAWIARAITLVESTRPDHRELAQRLLTELLPHSGEARRIGISGVPGVGKSTFIDAF